MRVLGVDFGFARIGLAVGETEVGIATARASIPAVEGLKKNAANLAEYAKKEEITQVVLGLPLDESEDGGRMARICRTLAEQLRALGLQVELVDESFTSVEADRTLRDEGLTAAGRRKQRDGEAACLIIERYLRGAQTS